jgi:hypothetical protein
MAHFDFDGIEDAQVFERGSFFPPDAVFYLKVHRMLVKGTRKSGPAFIAEFEVLYSTHPDVNVGAKKSWFQKLTDKEVAFPAIKEFMGALLGYSPDEKEEWKTFSGQLREILNEAGGFEGKAEDHPLHGETVKVSTWQKKTQNDKDFTVHDWATWAEEDGWQEA